MKPASKPQANMSEITMKEWVNEQIDSAEKLFDEKLTGLRNLIVQADEFREQALRLAREVQLEAIDLARKIVAEHLVLLNGHAEALRRNQLDYVQKTVYDRDIQEQKGINAAFTKDITELRQYQDNQQGQATVSGRNAGLISGIVASVVIALILRVLFPQ